MSMTRESIETWMQQRAASEANNLTISDEKAFGQPIVGFGNGSDELFDFYKKDIGEFYLLPQEWLAKKYGRCFEPSHLTVISWAFPQTEKAIEGNRLSDKYPCKLWSMNRTFGEVFNRETAKALEDWLDSQSVAAVAPMAHPDFKWADSEKYGLASLWSERHTAYICGLGTFGLCDGLISKIGKAVRYGSVIADIVLPTDIRPYTKYNEWCLGAEKCGACIKRCPGNAITPDGHDKNLCREYQTTHVLPYCKNYGFDGIYGCGLCQTGVPCEHCVPGHPELSRQ